MKGPDPTLMNRRGIALLNAYNHRGSLSLLRRSVAQFRSTLAVVGADHPERATVLSNLSAALLSSFERSGEVNLLAEAIEVGRAAVATGPEDHPGRPRRRRGTCPTWGP